MTAISELQKQQDEEDHGVHVRYLTSADLTGVIGRVEAVTGAVHSALKHAVCTQRYYE